MAATTPLQVLVFRHPDDKLALSYETAILRNFEGGSEVRGYVAAGEDLGIELRRFKDAPLDSTAIMLDAALHTVTVVLADRALLERGGDVWTWLGECWTHTRNSAGRHEMLVLPMEERQVGDVLEKCPALGSLQMVAPIALGEVALRPAMVALRLLHTCRVALARGIPDLARDPNPGYMRLFISHAKIDGLPLALALRYQIQQLPWLSGFYDADDLTPGSDWQLELEKGVRSSIIVMLRTDVYDSRYWCQQEAFWADEYATPAVLVDARTSLNYPSSVLPFDRVPSVRIPDGNLMRVLFLALREGLRFLHFKRRVEAMIATGALKQPLEFRAFSLPPSMAALLRACRSFAPAAPGTERVIIYPDPVLRTGAFEAAQTLVAAYAPGARLVTPNTLAATQGATP